MCAWKEFRKGKRSKSDVAEFELNLESNLFGLRERLKAGTWKPDPYHIFFVQDPKQRKIHKASVRDRVLYQAVYRSLYQIFDSGFIFHSYSSRINKGTHAGTRAFESFLKKITRNYAVPAYALKCDIRKFFDSIDHNTLFGLIRKKIGDSRLRDLIRIIIDSFETMSGKGLPLGNVTSQLFANIYMNELDRYVKRDIKVKYYIRYCDDFALASLSKEYLEHCTNKIRQFCKDQLLLDLHPYKIILRKIHSGFDVLGYVLLPHWRVLRTRTKKRVLKKVGELARGSDCSVTETDAHLQAVVQSYLGILTHCKGEKISDQIERLFWD